MAFTHDQITVARLLKSMPEAEAEMILKAVTGEKKTSEGTISQHSSGATELEKKTGEKEKTNAPGADGRMQGSVAAKGGKYEKTKPVQTVSGRSGSDPEKHKMAWEDAGLSGAGFKKKAKKSIEIVFDELNKSNVSDEAFEFIADILADIHKSVDEDPYEYTEMEKSNPTSSGKVPFTAEEALSDVKKRRAAREAKGADEKGGHGPVKDVTKEYKEKND